MVSDLLARLFGWGRSPRRRGRPAAGPRGPSAAGATGRTAARAPRFEAPQPVRPLLLQPEARDADLAALLRAELVLRAGALVDALPIDAAGDQGRALLEPFLAGEVGKAIRQPPLAARHALERALNPDADLRDVVRLFERDPSLTTALLRRANSVMYGGAAPVVALRDALQRLGMRGVHSVVVEVMLEGILCRPGGRYDAMVQDVWQHMARTAPLARLLSPCFGADGESALTLGLLHDVGKLIVFDRLATIRTEARAELDLPDRFVEDALVRLHEPLGGLTILQWGLGGTAARAVATHHRNPLRYDDERYSEVVCVAERVDHLVTRDARVDFEALWEAAALTGSREWVEQLVGARHEAAAV